MHSVESSMHANLVGSIVLLLLSLLLALRSEASLLTNDRHQEQYGDKDDFLYGTFPEGFLWGLSTASYQVEGGWDADGKGQNIWDFWSHESGGINIEDRSNGDVACDSYNKYLDDVGLLKTMGADFYRFSLSWSRIVPTGKIADGINKAGVDYYNNLINALLQEGIQPFVTLYHWDLPLALKVDGGWLNETTNDHFVDFARTIFDLFGDRVKRWITFNEPGVFCTSQWNFFFHDGFEEPPETPYICAHNVIKSHALVYRTYDRDFKPVQRGQVGITLNCDWPEPKNASDPGHVDASNRAVYFKYGWWAHPIVYGEYPPIMRTLLDSKSSAEGRNSSRLPTFDYEWTQIINGSTDFLGLNHYSSSIVVPTNGSNPGLSGDANVRYEGNPSWNKTGLGWAIFPSGFRETITWVSKMYHLPIYLTENGYGGLRNESLDDTERVSYYQSYIDEVLKSIVFNGSDVRSYTAWTLMDNFEWTQGYNARFGVFWTNFTDRNLTRIPKRSAVELTRIFAENGFPS